MIHSAFFCSLYIKNVFGGCGGNLEEDSQTESGIMDCSSEKEYLEKRASLFPGVVVDLLKEPEGGLYEDKNGYTGCFLLQNVELTSVRNARG